MNAIKGSSSMIYGGGVDSVNETYQQPPNQAGASQDNLGVICNGLEGLRERLERTLSDPEFDTTTSSVIAEMIGLISQVECGLSVGVEWGSGSDPELEESLIGLLNDTVSTSFQLDENVRGLLGASVEDVGGRGTLKTMWLKLKEMQRVLGLKRKWSAVDTSDTDGTSSKSSKNSTSEGSTCGLFGKLQIESSGTSGKGGGEGQSGLGDMEVERTNSPNGPLDFEMELSGSFYSSDDIGAGIDLETSNGTPPPPLEPHLWATDSGLSVPSTSTAGHESIKTSSELIDLTGNLTDGEVESGISANGGLSYSYRGDMSNYNFELGENWISETNWGYYRDDAWVTSIKGIAEVISSICRKYGHDAVRDRGHVTTLYINDGKVIRVVEGNDHGHDYYDGMNANDDCQNDDRYMGERHGYAYERLDSEYTSNDHDKYVEIDDYGYENNHNKDSYDMMGYDNDDQAVYDYGDDGEEVRGAGSGCDGCESAQVMPSLSAGHSSKVCDQDLVTGECQPSLLDLECDADAEDNCFSTDTDESSNQDI